MHSRCSLLTSTAQPCCAVKCGVTRPTCQLLLPPLSPTLQGELPYNSSGQLFCLRPVVYECGPWAGCSHGKDCPQARAVAQGRTPLRIQPPPAPLPTQSVNAPPAVTPLA